jgi:ABC-type hemin transport system ATPase subunit
LVTSIADRLIALELGAVIASGTPDEVVHHPEVVASYLGGDSAVIARSGAIETGSAEQLVVAAAGGIQPPRRRRGG